MQYNLYGGAVVLDFDEEAHKYTYNGELVPSVTTVTDIVDKSAALIPWALNQAEKYIRANFPIDSYVSQTLLDSLLEGMKQSHRKIKYKAADIGTQAHEWIENYIKAQMEFKEIPELPSNPQVSNAVLQFLEFEKQNHVVYLASERRVFSLINKFAGTLDILAHVNGIHTLLDIKTSNQYRKEYAMQSAAYVLAVNEEDNTGVQDRIILMLSKDEAKFEPVSLPSSELAADTAAFLSAFDLYRWGKAYRKPKKK